MIVFSEATPNIQWDTLKICKPSAAAIISWLFLETRGGGEGGGLGLDIRNQICGNVIFTVHNEVGAR